MFHRIPLQAILTSWSKEPCEKRWGGLHEKTCDRSDWSDVVFWEKLIPPNSSMALKRKLIDRTQSFKNISYILIISCKLLPSFQKPSIYHNLLTHLPCFWYTSTDNFQGFWLDGFTPPSQMAMVVESYMGSSELGMPAVYSLPVFWVEWSLLLAMILEVSSSFKRQNLQVL